MVAHAADGVGLDHGVDASFEEGREGELSVGTISVLVNANEFGVVHGGSIRLGGKCDSKCACPNGGRHTGGGIPLQNLSRTG